MKNMHTYEDVNPNLKYDVSERKVKQYYDTIKNKLDMEKPI